MADYNKVFTDLENQEKKKEFLNEVLNGIEDIQKRNRQEQEKIVCLFKFGLVFVCSILLLPFGITSTYYAFTDNSCVNLHAGKLYVTLKDYLAVQGIMYLIVYGFVLCSAIFSFEKISVIETITENPLFIIFNLLIKMFSSSWLILGCVIFWGLMDNTKCDDPIYNYVYALLIIQIVFSILNGFNSLKNKK